jgi:hypothetical protein
VLEDCIPNKCHTACAPTLDCFTVSDNMNISSVDKAFLFKEMNFGSTLGSDLTRARHSFFNSLGENFPGGFSIFKNYFAELL